ncbi:MAG: PASTA domain-containing protein [Verrucomicrobia bacterium]|nr:PASTA domain-containing protein [Cytophagales bacterium]
MNKKTSRKELLIHLGIMLCVLLIVFLGFFFVWLPFSTRHNQTETVQDLTDMPLEKVKEALRGKNLDYQVSDSNFIAGQKVPMVLAQIPVANSEVKPGRIILLTVSAVNPPMVKLPDLRNRSFRSAEMLLESLGLQKDKVEFRPEINELVLDQILNGKSIEPGTNVPKGSKITLVVGNGSKKTVVKVGDYIEKTQQEAVIAINQLGLQLKLRTEVRKDQKIGTVFKQNPEAGNQLSQGDQITIWVSVPKQRQIPKPDTTAIPVPIDTTVK